MVAAVVAIIVVSFLSCRQKAVDATPDSEVLVQVGDSALTMNDVLRRIPHGLDPADSALMFNSIVDKWVSELVMREIAEQNVPDMARIERMVEAYRTSLIVDEYLKTMTGKVNSDIPESRIREYYDSHRDEMKLQQPLVKGALIRVDANDPQLDNLRKWMTQFTDASFDNIEREGLKQATAYEYFRDTWYEWNEIADKIPYRFFDADAFVRSTRNLETTADGSVYLLHISDYLVSGEEMPYEFAKQKIGEILRSADIGAMRTRLKGDIYRRKIEEGYLKPGLYDPLKGEMKTETTKTR